MDPDGWRFLVDQLVRLCVGIAWPVAFVVIISRYMIAELQSVLKAITKKIGDLHRVRTPVATMEFRRLPFPPVSEIKGESIQEEGQENPGSRNI